MVDVEKILKLPKLGKDDVFSFGCNMCGSCCRNREDILLAPLDVFKIAKHMGKPIHEILSGHCESYEGEVSKIPIVRIKPREYRRTCPFAKKEGCFIHPVKPAVCALFPLGRMTDTRTNKFTYFMQPVSCGNKKHTQTVGKWLDDFSMLEEEGFTIIWHQKTWEMSEILKEVYKKTGFNHDSINSTLLMLLYLRYDLSADFMPQFTENCAEALRLAKLILGESQRELAEINHA